MNNKCVLIAGIPAKQYHQQYWTKYNTKERRHNQHLKYLTKTAPIREAKNKPCMDCGHSYPYYVMHFDHRDPSTKTIEIGKMVSKNFSLVRILEEIAKCDVVCANCHSIRTWKRYE